MIRGRKGSDVEKLLTVREAAEILRAHEKTVYGWIEKGLLRAQKLPTGGLRITQEAIDEFVEVESTEQKGRRELCRDGGETAENTSESS